MDKIKVRRKTKLTMMTPEERLERRRAQIRVSAAKCYANNRTEICRRRNAIYDNKGTSRGRPRSVGIEAPKKIIKVDINDNDSNININSNE